MDEPFEIKLYFAYTSPFTYLAMEPACDLERTHRVRLRFIPFGVNIRRVYGGADSRSARSQAKVRYLYMDARRFATERGLIIRAPKKIYSARTAFYGGLYAARNDRFRPYSDRVFERFWKGELDVEEQGAIESILAEVGLEPTDFRRYVQGRAREALDACFAEAGGDKVFGVPTFVVDRELFWGYDRIQWVIGKLDAMGLRRKEAD